jgi:arylsulfatase A-like enzyme
VDTHVGRVLAYLRETGEIDNTLVVFTSDHGEHLGDHHLLGKSGYFDAGFHVPLIVRDPGARSEGARGRTVDAFTEAVDVTPTLLDWLGLTVPAQCDGESLLPLVRTGAAPGWRTAAHWEFDFRDVRNQRTGSELGLAPDQCSLAVIRTERYKYVHFAGLKPLLFDLQVDPDELNDVAHEPDLLPQRVALAEAMLSWRATHADRSLANMQVGEGGLHTWVGPRRQPSNPTETL